MEKWLIIVLVCFAVLIIVYAMNTLSDKILQKISLNNQDYIIQKLDQLQANRTKQFIKLMNVSLENQNITIENQKIIKHNQDLIKASLNDAALTRSLIKNNTVRNLNLTIHNRAMLDDSNDRLHVITTLLGINDTVFEMKRLNLTHTPSPFLILATNNTNTTGKISSFNGIPIEILNSTQ